MLVISLAGVALVSVLHVAMQLQRREIMVTFQRAVFLKLVLSCVSALVSVLAAVFGGLEFRLHTRTSSLRLDMGVCFYLQVIYKTIVHYHLPKNEKTCPNTALSSKYLRR